MTSVGQLESGLLLNKMGDPSLGKGGGHKKDQEEEDVQSPSKATTTDGKSALSLSAESSKDVHRGSPQEESRKKSGKNVMEIASQPGQMSEPVELSALQLEERLESVPTPMRSSSQDSYVSTTNKKSSIHEEKAMVRDRGIRDVPSAAVHQATEDCSCRLCWYKFFDLVRN